jgi:thioredoxin reductase
MSAIYDVAVIGGGPAGLAAATFAARYALSIVLFDEQAQPGGRCYGPPTADTPMRSELHARAHSADALGAPLRQSGATSVFGATVWSARRRDDGLCEIGVAYGPPEARSVRIVLARAMIIATGALARPFPIPGGTLDGSISAADAQALLDAKGIDRSRRIVLAGNGPMLWRLAAQCIDAGVALEALLVTTPRAQRRRALGNVWNFALSPDFLPALALERNVRRRVRVIPYVTAIVRAARSQPGPRVSARGSQILSTHLLVLHQGMVPDINLGSALGCAHRWNDAQACFEPVVDAWGGSTLPGVFFAGAAAGIAGAAAAQARGELAALAVANALGRIDAKARDAAAVKPRASLARALRGRVFLDVLHRPADIYRIPHGATVVCRCENVTAGQVIGALREGAAGPNQVKAFTRCGMGPCQGRFCSLTVTELVARERRISAGRRDISGCAGP